MKNSADSLIQNLKMLKGYQSEFRKKLNVVLSGDNDKIIAEMNSSATVMRGEKGDVQTSIKPS